jgi:hypothetical protein
VRQLALGEAREAEKLPALLGDPHLLVGEDDAADELHVLLRSVQPREVRHLVEAGAQQLRHRLHVRYFTSS